MFTLRLGAESATRSVGQVERLTGRAWKKWATSFLPRLQLPEAWRSEGRAWQATTTAILGTPSEWFAEGVYRWPARWGGWFQAHMIVVPLYVPNDRLHIHVGTSAEVGDDGRRVREPDARDDRNDRG